MITIQRITKVMRRQFSKASLRLRKYLGAPPERVCPACETSVVGFFRYGNSAEWGCIECGASPRERLMNFLIINNAIRIPKDGSILHMAPSEKSLARCFSLARDYTPADIDPTRYTAPGISRVDLMTLDEMERYDLFYASHVMEHVPEDMVVLRNIFRALKPGGEAWLLVPLWDKATEDGPPDMSPREREQRFGQWDHVRQYGPDFADRIRSAGFDLEEIDARSLDPHARHLHALGDHLFLARKPV